MTDWLLEKYAARSATVAKYMDSTSVNRTTYKEIGTWRFTAQ
jgi:hypothetical protein